MLRLSKPLNVERRASLSILLLCPQSVQHRLIRARRLPPHSRVGSDSATERQERSQNTNGPSRCSPNCTAHLPLLQIKRSHARQFREALQDVPARRSGKLLNASLPELAQWGHEHPDVPKITAGTVNKQLTAVQAIANWAHDNGIIPDEEQWSDPFRRMRLGEDEAVRGGAPFELADLQVIFGTPVFAEGERPTGGKGEAAFWLPLLALFTGARLNELSSLKASDVAHSDIIGTHCISSKQKNGQESGLRQSSRNASSRCTRN